MYIYICMYVYIYVYIYVAFICIYINVCACACMYVSVCMDLCMDILCTVCMFNLYLHFVSHYLLTDPSPSPPSGLGMDASGMSPSGASLPPCTPSDEERPGSALSTASRTSRIPVLSRSASLRIKGSSAQAAEARPRGDSRSGAPSARGIVR